MVVFYLSQGMHQFTYRFKKKGKHTINVNAYIRSGSGIVVWLTASSQARFASSCRLDTHRLAILVPWLPPHKYEIYINKKQIKIFRIHTGKKIPAKIFLLRVSVVRWGKAELGRRERGEDQRGGTPDTLLTWLRLNLLLLFFLLRCLIVDLVVGGAGGEDGEVPDLVETPKSGGWEEIFFPDGGVSWGISAGNNGVVVLVFV